MYSRFPMVGSLFPYKLKYRSLKLIIFLHFPYHFIVLLIVQYNLPDGKRRSGFEFDGIHLFPPQVDFNRGRVRDHSVDIIVVHGEQLIGEGDGI